MGLTDLSDSALVNKGRTCYEMCQGNPHFVFPDGFLEQLKQACDALAALQEHVVFHGGILAHQQKREAAAALAGHIRTLAGSVSAQSMGDASKILSAGFELRRKASPVDALGLVQNLRPVLTSFTGEVNIRWERVPHATNYQIFANATDPEDPSAWQLVGFTSKSRYTVEALESGRFYWFRVQALGRKGLLSPLSQPVRALAA